MDIPNSPLQMQRQWIYQKLDELPEGSSVTIPVEQYRDMVTRQLQLSDLVARQQKMLEEHVPDYGTDRPHHAPVGQQAPCAAAAPT